MGLVWEAASEKQAHDDEDPLLYLNISNNISYKLHKKQRKLCTSFQHSHLYKTTNKLYYQLQLPQWNGQ